MELVANHNAIPEEDLRVPDPTEVVSGAEALARLEKREKAEQNKEGESKSGSNIIWRSLIPNGKKLKASKDSDKDQK